MAAAAVLLLVAAPGSILPMMGDEEEVWGEDVVSLLCRLLEAPLENGYKPVPEN